MERNDRLFTPGVSLATQDAVTGAVDQTTGDDQDIHPLLWGGYYLNWGGIPLVW